jgi:hypothetical protein
VDDGGYAFEWAGGSWSSGSDVDGYSTIDAVSCPTVYFCAIGDYNGDTQERSVYSSDTWTYAASGDVWARQSPPTSPPARAYASISYDAAAGVDVMFGGSGSGGPDSDTWNYDTSSGTWTEEASTGPPARFGASMSYDATAGAVVLFGGQSASGAELNDTWSWDGSSWSQDDGHSNGCTTTCPGPPAREGAALAYDASAGGDVLFGGYNGTNDGSSDPDDGDTWVFVASTAAWSERSPTASPSPRAYASMTASRSAEVLFGGSSWSNGEAWTGAESSGSPQGDTWSYAAAAGPGGTWSDLGPSPSPSARSGAALAFDAPSSKVVLFGGYGGSEDGGDTWQGDFGALLVEALPTMSWSTALSGYDQSLSTSSPVVVQDTVGAGWSVTASSTILSSGSGTLPEIQVNGSTSSSSSAVAPAATCTGGTGACILPSGNSVSYPLPVASSATTVYEANRATGADGVSLALVWWVGVPANAFAGTYSATLSISVASGP